MTKALVKVPAERIENAILFIRGEKVILDSDLARLYGVTTKRLNEQVKRNRERFPEDFMFKLTSGEKAEVVANCDHLKKLKFSPVLPFAFTEHGAIMRGPCAGSPRGVLVAANVLSSKGAVQASVQVVRAFIRLRQMLASNAELARKLSEIERKYDAQFKVVFDAIRQLMTPPQPQRKQIGFAKTTKK
jgi:hypothetical protein